MTHEDILAMDAEATAFAMELLMPEAWLRADIGLGGIDVEDERRLTALAKKYRVSVPVMTLRIGELMGLVDGTARSPQPIREEVRPSMTQPTSHQADERRR